MTVKDLKEIISKMPDNTGIRLVGWDRKNCKTTKQYIHQCANIEHQEDINELWLSNEGLQIV